jgi:hypothetical protein
MSAQSKTPALRYTVQVRDGRRWYTVKTFTPEHWSADVDREQIDDRGFKFAEKFARVCQRDGQGVKGKPFRVLLMPFNVVAGVL